MPGSYDELLPSHTVAGHVKELSRRVELLAVDHQVGAAPERLLSSIVGIRDLAFRLLGHVDEQVKAPQKSDGCRSVGFALPICENTDVPTRDSRPSEPQDC